MNIRRKLLKGAHLPEKKCVEVLQLFCDDLTATEIAGITRISRVTINNYCRILRSRILHHTHDGRHPVNQHQPGDHKGGTYYAFRHHRNRIVSEWLQEAVALSVLNNKNPSGEYKAIADSNTWNLHWLQAEARDSEAEQDIATFWTFTKARLQKFRGMNKKTIFLHIKESEFRYNNRDNDLFALLMDIIDDKSKGSFNSYHYTDSMSL